MRFPISNASSLLRLVKSWLFLHSPQATERNLHCHQQVLFSQSSAGGYPTNIEAHEMHLWHGKFPFDRFFVFYRWRRQSAHKAKNLKNAAAFNRINTVVEMFSSGYINSTDISCRPTSIGRLSRCTLQSRVEIKFPLRAITCDTLVRLSQNTLCPEVPLLWLGDFKHLS